MSYMHINNLYKEKDILLFKECYAMEKIHGTSSHVFYYPPNNNVECLDFFPGGEKLENFKKCFDEIKLTELIRKLALEISLDTNLIIYGEAYGGKCQGMSNTYGKELKFIAFEVKIGDKWLCVPDAEDVVKKLGLEFVHYEKVPTDIEVLDKLANSNSVQAIRNGCGEKLREGIVLRPLIELRKNNGERIITKHKNDTFKEREHLPKLNTQNLEVLKEANKIAEEWVTEMRLIHVLDNFSNATIKDTGTIIKAMLEDILRESKNEIIDNKEIRSAINKKTANLLHLHFTNTR